MTDKGQPPVLSGDNERGKDGKPRFGPVILRLYRNDYVWRGAVDLFLIGNVIMILAVGHPHLFGSPEKALQDSIANKAISLFVKLMRLDPLSAQQVPRATGTSPSSTNVQDQNSSPYRPKQVIGAVDRHWVNAPDEYAKKSLNAAADLIGSDNGVVREAMMEKARTGDPNAEYLIGFSYVSDSLKHAPEENLASAIYWYKESAALDNPAAAFQLGQIYRLAPTGARTDIGEAARWYEAAAQNPSNTTGEAENELGSLYLMGLHVPRDAEKARTYYEAAANKGLAAGAANLGALYLKGDLGSKDLEKAMFWSQRAADGGDAQGALNLATIYANEQPDNPDYPMFLKWAGIAADQGSTQAMIALAEFYREGKPGFPADQKAAARYYRLAALKKDAKAQFYLAEMYENGLGLPQDKIQAYIYYNLSYRDGGFAPAYQSLTALKATMSTSELEYAERMSKALTDASE